MRGDVPFEADLNISPIARLSGNLILSSKLKERELRVSTEDHVGARYVMYMQCVEIHTNSTRLPNENTVYQAELLAIKLAVD